MGQSQPQFIKGGVQRISSPIYQLNENNLPFWVMILIFQFISLFAPQRSSIIKHIYYFIFKTYMHPSFQSSSYTHSFQSQIHGPSNLKIFDGEDLSIIASIQPVEIVRGSSSCNLISGGDSKKRRNRGDKGWTDWKRKRSISRPSRSTSIASSLRKRNKKGWGIWKSHINRPICSSFKRRSTKKRFRESWKHRRNRDISSSSPATIFIRKIR